MTAPVSHSDDSDRLLEQFQEMVRFNLDNPEVVETARLNAALTHFEGVPLGDRVAAWATWFLDLGMVEYRFGLAPKGYVSEGRLCQDFATDCVLFMYRVTELARSTTAEEAVQFAFGTRFYGASIEGALTGGGRVDYDDPSHLEYSEELIASEIWGRDVTATVGEPVLADWTQFQELAASTDCSPAAMSSPDGAPDAKSGVSDPSNRPALPTLRYLPTAAIDFDRLKSGDILWFVGQPVSAPPEKDDGRVTLVHHLGFVDRRSGRVDLIHAAMKPLPGIYEESGLVRVPLAAYLKRVDRFRGVVVTRLAEF